MNLNSDDILNPASPTGPMLDARLTLDLLLTDHGDADPLQQIDFAIERLSEARGRFAALAEISEH